MDGTDGPEVEPGIERAVAALPEGGAVVALVPTSDRAEAARLARAFAEAAGAARPGHTLLLSAEGAPSALDRELGVESGIGLSAILAGEAPLRDVAARGAARGFIFVPAGEAPGDPATLLGSPAFASLAASASDRGGTVLVFVEREALDGASAHAFDVAIWLGPPPATAPEGWSALAATATDLAAASASASASRPRGPGLSAPRPRGPSGKASSAGPPLKVSPARRGEARRWSRRRGPMWPANGRPVRPWIALLVIAAVLIAIALTIFGLARFREPDSFLPDNDSLWLSRPETAPAPDTAPSNPDSTP